MRAREGGSGGACTLLARLAVQFVLDAIQLAEDRVSDVGEVSLGDVKPCHVYPLNLLSDVTAGGDDFKRRSNQTRI